MYLTQGLHRGMQLRPQGTATVHEGRSRTYSEVGGRVARLAAALQKLGMRPGDRVGMLALNSDRYFEYYLAVYWGGGVVNPVNTRWSPAEIAYSLDDCETKILIVDDGFAALVDELKQRSSSLRTIIHAGDGDAPGGMESFEGLIAGAQPVDDACRRGSDLAGVFYTGGTTGAPKGVMLSHQGIYSSALSMIAEGTLTQDSRSLIVMPVFHLAAGALMNATLAAGGSHIFVPSFTPAGTLAAMDSAAATHALFVPTMMQMLLDHPAFGAYDLSRLSTVFYGAASCSEALLDRVMEALPHVGLCQAYGMTELSPVVTMLPAYYHGREGRRLNKIRSAGRATVVAEIKVVDSAGREVPRGTVGEVAARGPGVMLGYWNKPEQTAAALRGGWMHTGDGAYMDEDGFVFIVDRLKDMIITGGENVYSAEVEQALHKHPAVALCAVIGLADAKWGERVHAVVVLHPGVMTTAEELQAHCRTLIAGYKCPRSFEFRDCLPMSGVGKILKNRLREEAASGAIPPLA